MHPMMRVVNNADEHIVDMMCDTSATTLLETVERAAGRGNLAYPSTSMRKGFTVGREDVAPLPVGTYVFNPALPGQSCNHGWPFHHFSLTPSFAKKPEQRLNII